MTAISEPIKPPKVSLQITPELLSKWRSNLIKFLLPLVIIYLTTTIAILSTPTHLFVITDLIPSQIVIGAMILYVLNALLDLASKVETSVN